MERVEKRLGEEEPRELADVAAGREHDAAGKDTGDDADDLSGAGTEDPAFYLKPSDER